MLKQTFPLVPASGGPQWFFVGIGVLLVGMVVMFGYIAYASRHTRCEVSPEGLRIAGTLYGRRIPLEALKPAEAVVTDLRQDPLRGLKLRTNGIGLPGYNAGWFRLQNGEKALAFVTNQRRVLYLPTREGFSLLVSVESPEGLLEALRAAAH